MKKDTREGQGREVLEEMTDKIEQTLNTFDVPIKVVKAIDGLRHYHFHLKTLKPVRMKVVKGFEDDLRYALASDKLNIEAPMPDATLIGVTVPKKGVVPKLSWNDVVKSELFSDSDDLVVPLGQDEFGVDHLVDMRRMPHLLIGGTNGSGKSMLLDSFINSLIWKHSPDQVRFIFADTKRWSLVQYRDIPHLLTPPITDAKQVIIALKWCIKETERRINIFQECLRQNISSYHEYIQDHPDLQESEPLPYIIIVLDDLADLMSAYPKELEACIMRITETSRIAGIHLIVSTKRPASSVFTPLLRTNIHAKIAFQTASPGDSKNIIDQGGAEKLVGDGDMLFSGLETVFPTRLQGYYITDEDIKKNIKALSKRYGNKSAHSRLELEPTQCDADEEDDDLFNKAKECAIEAGKISTSLLQRKLRIGYGRAARLIDLLEERGVVGPADGGKPREVIKE